eukprot:Seg1721.3 transcript_id=Seg1721.3/GoldUCD/mRNA.D3Y31 product=Beta-ureidopropionase protein_id=Seg1721.3/GoldUCD/D3Y31
MAEKNKGEIRSLEDVLAGKLDGNELKEVNRILYGSPVSDIDLPRRAKEIASSKNFALAGYKINAAEEQLRASRVVRIGAIQNQIILPTDAPIAEQITSLHNRIKEIIEAAAECNVNILCLQEAWTMPFAFCTREKKPWTEFAESAETGPTTKMLQQEQMFKAIILYHA